MSAFDRDLVAAKAAAVEQHLERVRARLPHDPAQLTPSSDVSDAVVLHLWQAVQLVLDLAFAACLYRCLPTPATYADAFRFLARAAGFRNLVAHAYEALDMNAVHAAATQGPADLRAFLAAMARLAPGTGTRTP